ncbi:hypothetical protein D3C74_172340 [compost metagenome]
MKRKGEGKMDEQRLREIIREELAAHEERLKSAQKPLFIDGKGLVESVTTYLQEDKSNSDSFAPKMFQGSLTTPDEGDGGNNQNPVP